ncbi:hypothetical protein GCM10020358_14000 [Amorphoplanes nipponensis]
MGSGVADQVTTYDAVGYARPDYLDFARWDGVATVSDPAIPAGYWAPHRRMKQYRGGHDETWGGVTINIDNDYLDLAPLPPARFADFTGNGWSDVLARATSTGVLSVHPGNGSFVDTAARRSLGTGWTAMNAIVRIGDLDGDGHEDLVARQSSNGDLWFYPGTGAGLGARTRIGTQWTGMREITGAGDFDRDGTPDLLAVRSSDGKLFLYPGRGSVRLGARVEVGSSGWNAMSELTGPGDFDGDGSADLVARNTSTSVLYLYPGRGTGFAARRQIGTGWGGMRDVLGAGDFDRDGRTDLVAVQTSTGRLLLYRGTGSALRAGVQIATGFGGLAPVA